MDSANPAPEPDPSGTPVPAPETRAQRHTRILMDLAARAHLLAQRASDRAQAEPCPANDRAFDRLARTVGQILALEVWLEEREATNRAERHKRQHAEGLERGIIQARRLRALLEPVIAATATPEKPLRRNFDALMHNPFMVEKLRARPLPEIIAEICQSLGIEPDRANWPPEFLPPPAPRLPASLDVPIPRPPATSTQRPTPDVLASRPP